MCQWSILWLDHINTNVAPQLALFDRLVHITRHLHNSASWDYVESLPPAWMCWFPFHNCQLLPKVHLKDICFVVSVCYVKKKTPIEMLRWAAIGRLYFTSALYFQYIYPSSHLCMLSTLTYPNTWFCVASSTSAVASAFFLFFYFLACSTVIFFKKEQRKKP